MGKLIEKKRMINVNTWVWKDKKDPSKGGSCITKPQEQTVLVEKASKEDK